MIMYVFYYFFFSLCISLSGLFVYKFPFTWICETPFGYLRGEAPSLLTHDVSRTHSFPYERHKIPFLPLMTLTISLISHTDLTSFLFLEHPFPTRLEEKDSNLEIQPRLGSFISVSDPSKLPYQRRKLRGMDIVTMMKLLPPILSFRFLSRLYLPYRG